MNRSTLLICVAVCSLQLSSTYGHFGTRAISPISLEPVSSLQSTDALTKIASKNMITMMTVISSHPSLLCIIHPSIIVKLLTDIACNPILFNSIPHNVLSGFMSALKIIPSLEQSIPKDILQLIHGSIASVSSIIPPPVPSIPLPAVPSIPLPVVPSIPLPAVPSIPPPVVPSIPPPVVPSILPPVVPSISPPVVPSIPPPVVPSIPPPVVPSIPPPVAPSIPSPVAPSIPPPVVPSIPPPVVPSIPPPVVPSYPPPAVPSLPPPAILSLPLPVVPAPIVPAAIPSVPTPPVVPSPPSALPLSIQPMSPPAVFPLSFPPQVPGLPGVLCPTSLIPNLCQENIIPSLPELPKIIPFKHKINKPIINRRPEINFPVLPPLPKISLPKIVFPPTELHIPYPTPSEIVPKPILPPKTVPCENEVKKPLSNIIPWASKSLEAIIKCLLEIAPNSIVVPQSSQPSATENVGKEKPIVPITPSDTSKILILIPSTTTAHNPAPPTSVGSSPTAQNVFNKHEKNNAILEKLMNLKKINNSNSGTGHLKPIPKIPVHSKVPC